MHALVNLVDLGVVGDRLQGDVRHGLVDEAALQPLMRIAQGMIIEAGGHQPLLGQCDGDARGVAGDPPAPPFFGHECSGARSTGRVEYEVARIGGHQETALNHCGRRLDDVHFIRATSYVGPNVRNLVSREVIKKSFIAERSGASAHSPSTNNAAKTGLSGFPVPA